MWELICHHTYKLEGAPIDLSVYESHGRHEQFQAGDALVDGVAPGSGAVSFPRPGSRIRVPTSEAWQPLGGIEVEVTARRHYPQSHNQTLIAGHNSFSFYIENSFLHATFRTNKSTYPLQNIDGLSSSTHALPELGPYRLPRGEWMTLGFMHDGLDTMELYVDGHIIARRSGLLAGVPPVGPLGVSIGNEPDRNEPLSGEIDETKVWRLDPDAMRRQFLARPYDQATADCWEEFLRSLREALAKRPDCAQLLGHRFASVLDRVLRAIVAKGPETRERYARTCEEYARLWKSGQLDGPEMKQLFADWCTWLRLVGISIEDDPELRQLLQEPCLKEVLAECKGLECDPQAAALVQLIVEGCSPNQNTAT